MDDTATATNPVSEAAKSKAPEEAQWPLSFCLQPPKANPTSLQAHGFRTNNAPARRWWSHQLYRGPDNQEVEILYSRNKAQSELIAQHFINEPILGFDMEWPWKGRMSNCLQNKVGLIQIASESKIGLFHIGLHPGKTTEDIIAPTLRRIIESPKIGKVGVHILQADFGRLHRFFGLKPQGAIELSHLYRLVKFGTNKPELVSIKLVSLAQQVEDQLGLPLYKGDVRTSNWSKPLSKEQIAYAAGDAYAGFMLYHCMNAKRLAMKPTPPRPIFAERYPKDLASRDDPILLDSGGGTTITTEAFFGVKPVKSGSAEANALQRNAVVVTTTPSRKPFDVLTQSLLDQLKSRRATLAESAKLPADRIISDQLLELLVHERPSDTAGLLSVKGIGKIQQQKYGDEWLKIISTFLVTNGLESPKKDAPSEMSQKATSSTALRKAPRRKTRRQDSPGSPPAFDTPPPRTPQLQTGLSFTMAGTTLNAGDDDNISLLDSDGSLPDLQFGSPSREISSQLKRKRIESPTKHRISPATQIKQGVSPHVRQPDFDPMPTTKPQLLVPLAVQPTSSMIVAVGELSPRSKIARNKLMALSKLVTRKLQDRPANARPIVTERTLDLIVQSSPQTQDDLERIPGIDGFLLACEKTGTNLLKNVLKFAPSPASTATRNLAT
ncbi:hypothetical protein J1614_000817 [Plenodomus biglobosus]|nr:hypothetical protein J1614_000817 [Plenodomus biglobosus]